MVQQQESAAVASEQVSYFLISWPLAVLSCISAMVRSAKAFRLQFRSQGGHMTEDECAASQLNA
jgi:hypothetical protein